MRKICHKHLAIVLVLSLILCAFGQPAIAKTAKKPKVTGALQIDEGRTDTIKIRANGLKVKDVKAFPIGDGIDVTAVSKTSVKVAGLSAGTGLVRVFVTATTKANKKKKIKASTQIYAYYTAVTVLESNTPEPGEPTPPVQTTVPVQTPTPTLAPTPTPSPEITPAPSDPATVEVINNNANVTATCSSSTVTPGDKFTVSLTPTGGREFNEYGANAVPYPATFQANYEKVDGGIGLITYLQVKKPDLYEKTFTVPDDIVGGSTITVTIK
ncbi:MAG: hypothetical protein VZQ83_08400 [Eubacterium sp.]|nr:hypothetical protein [Eubacterium sp.]